jgi:signal transduction histidine kinase
MARSETRSSLRRLVVAMVVLGALLFSASGVAVVVVRQTLRDRLADRADFEVQRALFQDDAPEADVPLAGECSVGTLTLGTAGAGAAAPYPLDDPTWAAIVSGGSSVKERRIEQRGLPVVVGARTQADGRIRWARVVVSEPAEFRAWRLVGIALTSILVALLFTASRAVLSVRRAARHLRGSVEALKDDLQSVVPSTGVVELEVVADGLRSLSLDLQSAQAERERLLAVIAHDERLAAVGRLTAGLAHEIRNPLAAIKLRVDLVSESHPSPELRADLSVVAEEVARLDRLLSDLLLLTRPSPRFLSPRNLGHLAAERALLVRPIAALRDVSLAVTGDATLTCDADAIARALDNLLRNAIDASPAHARVDVSVEHASDEVVIVVADQGPGTAPESAARIFEPFFTTKLEGTGLGLALARAVARAHGGSLEYERVGPRTRLIMRLRDG